MMIENSENNKNLETFMPDLPATKLLSETLQELSIELAPKLQYMIEKRNKFEKWFQFKFAYYLAKKGSRSGFVAKDVKCEVSRKYDQRKTSKKGSIGRTDIEFGIRKFSNKTRYAIEIKIRSTPMNFDGVLGDMKKADNYRLSKWDFRGFFYVLIVNSIIDKTKADQLKGRHFKDELCKANFAKCFPIEGTNYQIIFIYWEEKTTEKKNLRVKYKSKFLEPVFELWEKAKKSTSLKK